MPELENLIAMSRIFGVTIGALLGVEPEAAEDRSEERCRRKPPVKSAEGTAPAGELTDRELAAVEAIAQKYLEAAQAAQNPGGAGGENSPRAPGSAARAADGGRWFWTASFPPWGAGWIRSRTR